LLFILWLPIRYFHFLSLIFDIFVISFDYFFVFISFHYYSSYSLHIIYHYFIFFRCFSSLFHIIFFVTSILFHFMPFSWFSSFILDAIFDWIASCFTFHIFFMYTSLYFHFIFLQWLFLFSLFALFISISIFHDMILFSIPFRDSTFFDAFIGHCHYFHIEFRYFIIISLSFAIITPDWNISFHFESFSISSSHTFEHFLCYFWCHLYRYYSRLVSSMSGFHLLLSSAFFIFPFSFRVFPHRLLHYIISSLPHSCFSFLFIFVFFHYFSELIFCRHSSRHIFFAYFLHHFLLIITFFTYYMLLFMPDFLRIFFLFAFSLIDASIFCPFISSLSFSYFFHSFRHRSRFH